MGGLINGLISLLLTLSLSFSVAGAIETEPQAAVNDFLRGLTEGNPQVFQTYMDNQYINFLVNVKGDEDTVKKMDKALFQNLTYDIEGIASKGDVAVAKVKIRTNNFSKVMDKYDKASYEYVLDNMYKDKVTDKERLNKECFRIYVDQIEKIAEGKPKKESEIFIPMASDGYGGWDILLTDDIMQSLIGGLTIPTINDK